MDKGSMPRGSQSNGEVGSQGAQGTQSLPQFSSFGLSAVFQLD